MSNTLDYALNLNANPFTKGVAAAQQGLASLAAKIAATAGAFLSARSIIHHTWAAIEQGAMLADLSKQTQTSVASLYQLQGAFQMAGQSAEAVPSAVLRLQKALSGATETGEKTGDLLERIGLSQEKLRGMAPEQAIQAVIGKVKELDQSSALDLSGKIFGRDLGNTIVGLSRDLEGFNAGLADSAKTANILAVAAPVFDRIDELVDSVKMKVQGFWAALALSAAPAVEAALAWVKSLDLEGLGQKIGTVITKLTNAFKDHKVGELLKLSFQAAGEQLGATLYASWKALGAAFNNFDFSGLAIGFLKAMLGAIGSLGLALRGALAGPLDWLNARVRQAFERLHGLDRPFETILGEVKAETQALLKPLQTSTKQYLQQGITAINNAGWGRSATAFSDTFSREIALASAGPATKQLATLWASLGQLPTAPEALAKHFGKALDFTAKDKKKTEATDLEKMGFVLGGGLAYNAQLETARHTAEIARNTRLLRPGEWRGVPFPLPDTAPSRPPAANPLDLALTNSFLGASARNTTPRPPFLNR
jgi:tetrahydromethanopterin S-methyltransferase subunit F